MRLLRIEASTPCPEGSLEGNRNDEPFDEHEAATSDISPQGVALIAGIGLLFIALLTPFARLGMLQSLVVPADAAATVDKVTASEWLFRVGIAAFLTVVMLDVVVAWAEYVLLRPVSRTLAVLVGWLRSACAKITHLGDVPNVAGVAP